MGKIKGKRVLASLVCLLIACMVLYGLADRMLPDELSAFRGETKIKNGFYTVEVKDTTIEAVEAFRTTETSSTCYKTGATLKLFGVLPLKTVQVNIYSKDMLIPGGIPFGVKLYTRGVVVVGISQVQGVSRGRSPAGEAGIEKGDVILSIDEQDVNTVQDVSKIIEDSNGQPVTVILQRGNQKKEVTLNPEKCSVEKRYKCGMWIRDSTAGIGTVTFIKPDTMEFGGLGHGICDSDTGTLMPLMRGNVVSVSILDIVKGSEGAPGELKGSFDSVQIGSLLANTSRGVFGTLTELPKGTKMNALPIGLKDEVQVGEATIYTTINGKGVRAYTAKIEKIIDKDVETKNFIIRVTDPALIKVTGGIVQGMSGSPIVQNGKIIGAVTHVLVNEPTKGYGIFIENMLKCLSDLS